MSIFSYFRKKKLAREATHLLVVSRTASPFTRPVLAGWQTSHR